MSEKNNYLPNRIASQETSLEPSPGNFRRLAGDVHGIDGPSPVERINQLRGMSTRDVASMLDGMNKLALGADESQLSSDKVMKIGEQETIKPEHRYDVFDKLIQDIKTSSSDVTPERVADTLALGLLLLHPFKDGNGRTARMVGLLFRDTYDGPDFEDDFNTVVASRDESRAKGGFMINGYVPRFSEGFDQSDPTQVSGYLHDLLTKEMDGAYVSCFAETTLYPS